VLFGRIWKFRDQAYCKYDSISGYFQTIELNRNPWFICFTAPFLSFYTATKAQCTESGPLIPVNRPKLPRRIPQKDELDKKTAVLSTINSIENMEE
jgi:hypothetical protein